MCICARDLDSLYASPEAKGALQCGRRTLSAQEGTLRDRMLNSGASRVETEAVLEPRQRVYQEGDENSPKIPAFLLQQAD
jgi:hypothetical protein